MTMGADDVDKDDNAITLHLTVTAEQGAPRVPLQINKSATPTELRKQASETTKIPLTALKLIFRGRLIGDDDSKEAATEFKLEEGSVLHCMGKPVKNGDAVNAAAAAQPSSTTVAALPAGPTVSVQPAATAPSGPPAAAAAAPMDPLPAALQQIRAQNTPQVYETAVTTLQKILQNIVQHPLEEKYRRVKKQNAAFQRRLGGLHGGDAAMKAAGFVTQVDDSGEQVYFLQASAEAWPQLLANQALMETAVQDAKAAVNRASAPPPPLPSMIPPSALGMPGGLPGMGNLNLPPGMQSTMANLMSNPNQLQALLQVRFFLVDMWLSLDSELSSRHSFRKIDIVHFFLLVSLFRIQ